MICSGLRTRPRISHARRIQVSSVTKRAYRRWQWAEGADTVGIDYSQHPVRIFGPTIWAITACGTIYFTCAAFDVYQDVSRHRKEGRRDLTFEQIRCDRARRRSREDVSDTYFGNVKLNGPVVATSPSTVWNSLSGPSQVITTIAGVNVASLALSRSPSYSVQTWCKDLVHYPLDSYFKNRQLLTSMFAHTGPGHLSMNVVALCCFGPPVAETSMLMNGSASHFLAFYLSSGVFSALGHHFSTLLWPNKYHRFGSALGASGATSAVFAAWCMTHLDAMVQPLVLPKAFKFRVHDILCFQVAFEVLGLLGLWRNLMLPFRLAHGTHLTGLAIGAAYATYGKNEKVWTPARRTAFQSMKLLGFI